VPPPDPPIQCWVRPLTIHEVNIVLGGAGGRGVLSPSVKERQNSLMKFRQKLEAFCVGWPSRRQSSVGPRMREIGREKKRRARQKRTDLTIKFVHVCARFLLIFVGIFDVHKSREPRLKSKWTRNHAMPRRPARKKSRVSLAAQNNQEKRDIKILQIP